MTIDLDADEWAGERTGPTYAERLVALEAAVLELGVAAPAAAEPEAPSPPKYETLPAFVTWLASWYTRDVSHGSTVWCPEWWRYHPEGVIRLEPVWRSYEKARLDPADGIASWLRDVLDPTMRVLLSEDGPWPRCNGAHRGSPPPLPLVDPPEEWWTKADSGL